MTAVQPPAVIEEVEALPITEPLELLFYSGVGGWMTSLALNPDGSFVGEYSDANCDTVYVCQFHGQFGNVGKLTDASWLLTMEELVLDTGHELGEQWDVTEEGYTVWTGQPSSLAHNLSSIVRKLLGTSREQSFTVQ